MRDALVAMSRVMFRWVDFNDNYGRDVIVEFANGDIKKKQKQNKVILDIGAGEGDDLFNIQRSQPDAELHALESWEPNVKLLTSRGVKVHHVDIEKMKLPFKDDSVDVVICNQILEHTKDIFWILHEIMRVLKKDGRIIVGVPNLAALHNRLILLTGTTPECMTLRGSHVRGFTFSDFNRLMNTYGSAKLVGRRGTGFYPFPRFIAKPLTRVLPGLSWGLFVCYEKTGKYNGEFLKEGARFAATSYYLGPDEAKYRADITTTVH